MAKATFGGGCFWGVEADFRRLDGVSATAVGYAGGRVDNPTYEQVCSNMTGHAEVVQVDFDPEVISYEALVDRFWKLHDPTQINRQGPDFGTQYRTVIFTHDDEQAAIAQASKERAQPSFGKPIATEILPAPTFWPAEEYHQRYLEKKGLASCTVQLQQQTTAP
jgi:peptide-methionine (S)-S-oxide reductase